MMLQVLISTLLLEAVLSQEAASCPEIRCTKPCNYGAEKDLQGCPTCTCVAQECSGITCMAGEVCKVFSLSRQQDKFGLCVDPSLPPACQQPMDTGPCKAAHTKWYYDNDEHACEEFTYGGCQGNDNRFNTSDLCQQKCHKTVMDTGKAGCSRATCYMFCEHGFKNDDAGCPICECRKNAPPLVGNSGGHQEVFNVALGCDEDSEISCTMHCPSGFRLDAKGCSVCECVTPPECGPDPQCTETCQHGRHLDGKGCPTCDCRQQGECSKLDCYMYCPFGRTMDPYNCPKCECTEDPCNLIDCGPDTVCKVFNRTQAKCVIEQSGWDAACSGPMCAMYCENGFVTDKYGCDVCKCRTENMPECALRKCVPCDYGYVFDEFGCRTCQCLPDPCLTSICPLQEVCSMEWHCIGCPARSKCIGKASVQRVHVTVLYRHDPIENLDMDHVKTALLKHLIHSMDVMEENIAAMKVKALDKDRVELDFHLIEEGRVKDVLPVYDAFKSLRSDQAAFTYSKNTFVPEAETYHGEYYAQKAPPGGDTGEAKDGTSTYIIIGCVAGGAVALLVGAIIAAVVVKSKSKSKEPSKNVIYRQAPSTDSEASKA